MTNEITSWLSTGAGALAELQRQPIGIVLVAALVVMGGVLKAVAIFPNRFIPLAVLVMGAGSNYFLGDPGAIPPSQRHPEAVLALHGLLLGFAAWALHAFLLRRLEKYVPLLAGKSGDTIEIKKEDVEK